MLNAHSSLIRVPQAKLKPVGAGVAVYVPQHKGIHVLNQTAQLLFELLAEPTSLAELIDALTHATDGEPDRVAADVETAVTELLDKGLVVEATE